MGREDSNREPFCKRFLEISKDKQCLSSKNVEKFHMVITCNCNDIQLLSGTGGINLLTPPRKKSPSDANLFVFRKRRILILKAGARSVTVKRIIICALHSYTAEKKWNIMAITNNYILIFYTWAIFIFFVYTVAPLIDWFEFRIHVVNGDQGKPQKKLYF